MWRQLARLLLWGLIGVVVIGVFGPVLVNLVYSIPDPLLDKLNRIGPFLGGLGVIIGATAAWFAYFFVQRRNAYLQWVDGFRAIYAEFWKDDVISQVRRWITSDKEYETLKKVLDLRLCGERNNLTPQENETIEKLDRFLALIMRVESFDKGRWHADQKELWDSLFERFWIKLLFSRPEVCQYIFKYWHALYRQTHRSDSKIGLR
jgi:hypothetical protein